MANEKQTALLQTCLTQDSEEGPLLETRPVRSKGSEIRRRTRFIAATLLALGLVFVISFKSFHTICSIRHGRSPTTNDHVRHFARAVASSFLEVFQVYPPVLTVIPSGTLEITDGSSTGSVKVIDSDQETCQEVLAVHSFGLSYGQPFVGQYTPPSCSFNRVTWNLTVVSAGRQYDRLGSVWLGDIEVFRTTTAEPTTNGIEWTYLKDMTNFLTLFKSEQKIIFDLGNLISNIYTAPFNVTLTASFFTAGDSISPADEIIPVSTHQSAENMPSIFTVPPDTASNSLMLPRNVKKAVFTIAATGQSAEEFWWSNLPESKASTFPSYGGAYGYSPFREVQLFIDGMLAGVVWPFPVIFTGGVVPGLWRPIVGIDAFDLKEDEIDITPFLPLLCDGKAHNFTVRVSGLNDDGNGGATLSETTDGYWLVSGKVFIWLDAQGHITTGSGPHLNLPPPSFRVTSSLSQLSNGTNETVVYNVCAQRTLSITSNINLSHGNESVYWRQSLSYSNAGNDSDQGNSQINNQQTNGYDASSSGYSRQISYPLYANQVQGMNGDNFSIVATVNRGKTVKILGRPVFPSGLESYSAAAGFHSSYPQFQGSSLVTTQDGQATYMSNQTAETSYSFGMTTQDMTFSGIKVELQNNSQSFPAITGNRELFKRHVMAVNATVVEDDETLVDNQIGHAHGRGGARAQFVISSNAHHGRK